MKYDGHLNPTQITQIEVRTKWRGNIHREGRKRPKLPAAKVMNLTGKQHSNEFMFKFIEISKLIIVNGWSCLILYTRQRHLRNCNCYWYQQFRLSTVVENRKKMIVLWVEVVCDVFESVTLCICYVMHCQILTEIFKSHKLPVDRKQDLKLSFGAIQQATTTRKKRKWFHWTINCCLALK